VDYLRKPDRKRLVARLREFEAQLSAMDLPPSEPISVALGDDTFTLRWLNDAFVGDPEVMVLADLDDSHLIAAIMALPQLVDVMLAQHKRNKLSFQTVMDSLDQAWAKWNRETIESPENLPERGEEPPRFYIEVRRMLRDALVKAGVVGSDSQLAVNGSALDLMDEYNDASPAEREDIQSLMMTALSGYAHDPSHSEEASVEGNVPED
jgi:hypothetical protein